VWPMALRRHGWLVALLLAGVTIRLTLVLAYTPAYLSYPDTWGYVKAAAGPLFMDDWIRPVGYPAFLAALHAIWGSLVFAVVVQHLLGLVNAVLLYATVRRLGAPVWVSLVPAAVVLLCVDVVYFEHTLLSESLFLLLSTASLYALARALDDPPERRAVAWCAAAGLAALLAVIVRPTGLFVLPVLGLAALLAAGSLRLRLARAATLTAVVVAGMLGYFALNAAQTGTFGLTDGSGWTSYARAAPFADCRVFTPPPGTAGLCESTDARDRRGPDFYAWDTRSPGRRLFIGPPYDGDKVGAWGQAAIRAQPRAYLEAGARDLWRYVDHSDHKPRRGFGADPRLMQIDVRSPYAEDLNRRQVAPFYGPYRIDVDGAVGVLADVQSVVRVPGWGIVLAIVLSLASLPFATGRQRIALLLLGGGAVTTLVLATATTVYNWRYAVPVLPFLLASGALGAHVLASALARRPARLRGRVGSRAAALE
jgi:hypothetical protein